MKGIILKLALILIASCFYSACKKPETYDVVPHIAFESFGILKYQSGRDSLSVITISFTDGDGDIGYHPEGGNGNFDSLFIHGVYNIYYRDFVVSLFQKRNGLWVEDLANECDTCVGYSGRIPFLTPDGANKALKGDISMNQFLPLIPFDTIRYSVYIYDRALNKSNTITTSEIVVNTN